MTTHFVPPTPRAANGGPRSDLSFSGKVRYIVSEPLRSISEKLGDASDCSILAFREPQVDVTEAILDEAEPISALTYPAVVQVPPLPARQENFRSLQKWEGVVLEIDGEVFRARLVDLTGSGPEEEAEIYVDEVSPADKDLFKPGAVFYWNIGYVDSVTGQRRRASEIRFRRLPAWTEEEIDAIREEGKRLFESIQWK